MHVPSWLCSLASLLTPTHSRRSPRRPPSRPRVEGLEDRTAPAVFTVTNTGDNGGVNPAAFAGTGTLRQAIIDANATPGADTITFALPDSLKGSGGWWTIQPLSALPEVTDPATIDGWSQAGAGRGLAPKVMLDGTFAGLANGLVLDNNSTVRGLAIGNFAGGKAGIMLSPDGAPRIGGNTVQGCYVGLDPSGTTAAPNNDGVADFLVNNNSSPPTGNTIGGANPGEGNVMSGNDLDVDSRGFGVTIRGNIIGLNAAGTAVLFANSATLRVGFAPPVYYTSVIADNVIAGSRVSGIEVTEARHVIITGNLIGTDITGTHAIPNARDGITVKGATDVIIGGTDPGSGNVIVANGERGIVFGNVSAAVVQGNYIGTPASGMTTPGFGNGLDGIVISGAASCLIGGSDPGAGNLIAGNAGPGISIGSAFGVMAASDDIIRGNVIRDNGSGGVLISQGDTTWPAPVGDTISQNSIYGNTGEPGIDLLKDNISPGGVTLNDSLGHAGTNHFQNFPDLAGVARTADGITVTGTLTQAVTPNTQFRIEFFANTEDGYLGPDGNRYGPGERYLGSVDVTTDANGVASIAASLPALLAGDRFVTATATNLATGDTSEFSAALAVPAAPPPSSLSGTVFEDFNNDGEVDFGERGIPGVTIHLTGTDDLGNAVEQCMETDADGAYYFLNLRPGNYYLTETQPAGYTQGIDTVGTAGGSLVATDQFFVVLGAGVNGLNYNFGERPPSSGSIQQGQTAGIGFWNNKNGQNLIKALPVVTNADGSVTSVAYWLAATLPNIFGANSGNDLAGKSNADVAALFQSDFILKGVKLDAQVLATALSVYVTNATLDSTQVAAQYGFTVSGAGAGTATVNVGSNGDAFGVADNTTLSVLDLLLATDAQAVNGVLYNGNATKRNHANNVYSAVNQAGDLN
jgi:hypothetical protein